MHLSCTYNIIARVVHRCRHVGMGVDCSSSTAKFFGWVGRGAKKIIGVVGYVWRSLNHHQCIGTERCTVGSSGTSFFSHRVYLSHWST